MRISNVQLAELAEIANNARFPKSDFVAMTTPTRFNIKYKFDYFEFDILKLDIDSYNVKRHNTRSLNPYEHLCTWEVVKNMFADWITMLAEELSTPTGWESFENQVSLQPSVEDMGERFTPEEIAKAKQGLSYLIDRIKILELEQGKKDIIISKLSGLEDKLLEMDKFDWKSQVIGVIANLIIVLMLPPSVSGALWEYLKITFENLLPH